jgi:hypothetical protein
MGYRYWNGTEWVRISAAEAAVRRQRGDRVIERPDPVEAPVSAAPHAAATLPGSLESGDISLDDLDDDQLAELEKLTAPGATSGG